MTSRVLTHAEFLKLAQNRSSSNQRSLVKIQIEDLAWINAQFGTSLGDQAIFAFREAMFGVEEIELFGEVSHSIYACLSKEDVPPEVLFSRVSSVVEALNANNNWGFSIEVAIGGVVMNEGSSEPMQFWIERANKALLVSGHTGRPTVYKSEFDIQIEVRQLLNKLAKNQTAPEDFHWVYQPVVNLATLKVVGYEALVRWDVPGHGFVSPELFIPIAEDLGVVSLIDRWAIEAASLASQELLNEPSQGMGVNVSAVTLERDDSFVEFVLEVAKNQGFGAGSLVLELTETAVIQNIEVVASICRRLRGAGVKISIDDFGKGETNLHTLGVLPIDYIKLDKSLLRLPTMEQRVSMLKIGAEMSKLLGAVVLCEGIETEEDLSVARRAHVALGQGWHLGLPQPLEELIDGKS